MGNFISPLAKIFGFHSVIEAKILMCGLDAAGKTTLLYKLNKSNVETTIPTIGFNVETIAYKGINFISWDVGGRDKIRALYRHYYHDVNAIIFVVDSNDKDRMEEAQYELKKISKDDQLKDAIFLIFANKQDLPKAMSVQEISQKLNLSSIHQPWFIQASCGTTGEGVFEGLDWIASNLKKST